MTTRVLKFGGSSFRTLECYRDVADTLIARLGSDADRLVVVVSAMHGDTDRLLSAGLAVCPRPSGEAIDSLITTGEVISAALLRMALDARGVPASMLDGHRLGIVSDSNFTRAAIRSVTDAQLRRELANHRVIVVTGAQAVDDQARLTMLGRNSSDLTAVALAGALSLRDCEILSDVAGVYSADPYIFPNARLLPEVAHEQLIAMSRSGAKVIHFGAAEYARRHDIEIICRSTADPTRIGTVVRSSPRAAGVVVLNEKASLFAFPSREVRRLAERCLAASAVDSIALTSGRRALLASHPSPVPAIETMRSAGIEAAPLADLALITVFDRSGRMRRLAVDRGVARDVAERLHDAMYSAVPSHGRMRPGPAIGDRPSTGGALLASIGARGAT
jgi:aspartate kinase